MGKSRGIAVKHVPGKHKGHAIFIQVLFTFPITRRNCTLMSVVMIEAYDSPKETQSSVIRKEWEGAAIKAIRVK